MFSAICSSHAYRAHIGGTTYCALACLYLAPSSSSASSHPHASSSSHLNSSSSSSQDPSSSLPPSPLSPSEHANTLRWLVHTQDSSSGGFVGRTGKLADACYCFWCGAGIEILGHGDVVDRDALAGFMGRCQYKFGGIAKAPGEHPGQCFTLLSADVTCLTFLATHFTPLSVLTKLNLVDHYFVGLGIFRSVSYVPFVCYDRDVSASKSEPGLTTHRPFIKIKTSRRSRRARCRDCGREGETRGMDDRGVGSAFECEEGDGGVGEGEDWRVGSCYLD